MNGRPSRYGSVRGRVSAIAFAFCIAFTGCTSSDSENDDNNGLDENDDSVEHSLPEGIVVNDVHWEGVPGPEWFVEEHSGERERLSLAFEVHNERDEPARLNLTYVLLDSEGNEMNVENSGTRNDLIAMGSDFAVGEGSSIEVGEIVSRPVELVDEIEDVVVEVKDVEEHLDPFALEAEAVEIQDNFVDREGFDFVTVDITNHGEDRINGVEISTSYRDADNGLLGSFLHTPGLACEEDQELCVEEFEPVIGPGETVTQTFPTALYPGITEGDVEVFAWPSRA